MKTPKIKRYRLGVSRNFPTTHPRKGEPTYFIDSIKAKLKGHELLCDCGWTGKYSELKEKTLDNGFSSAGEACYVGEVLEVNGMVVMLSQKVYFDAGETYSIRFTRRDGSITGAITCTAGASANKIVLASLPDEPIYTGYMQSRTIFTLAPDAERTALPFLIRDIEAKETGGLEVRKLSGVNYDQRYYQQDLLL